MSSKFLLKINFQTQGVVKGASTKGRDLDWLHLVHCELGAGAVGPAGGTSSGSLVITREVDGASPLFWQALSTNETLSSVVITQRGPAPASHLIWRVTLTNVTIKAIRPHLGPHRGNSGRVEDLTLSYETIRQDRY